METFVLAALAVALIAAVLALVRESRLRRALQKLLNAISKNWRPNETKRDP
jgi:HAMP domain-containing protein